MGRVRCGPAAVAERPEHTHQGYRRFRGCDRGKQFNERTGGLTNRTQHPSGVVALVVPWRLRSRLTTPASPPKPAPPPTTWRSPP